jgi:CAAX prenyl protease-like protein
MNVAVLAPDRHRDALVRVLPFGIYIVFLAVAPMLDRLLSGFDQRWLYAVQVGVVAVALTIFARRYVELFTGPRLKWSQWVATLAIGIAVFVMWINLDLPWARLGEGSSGFDPRAADGAIDWPLAAVRLFGAAAIVPLMEELFWRSFLMRWFDRPAFLEVYPATVSLRALAVTSLVFGAEHNLWLAGAIAGMAYGWLYVRTCSLWSPILAHAVTNLMLGLWILQTGSWRFW